MQAQVIEANNITDVRILQLLCLRVGRKCTTKTHLAQAGKTDTPTPSCKIQIP